MSVLLGSCLATWALVTLAALSAAVIGKVGLGMLRAYYILRVRARERQCLASVVPGVMDACTCCTAVLYLLCSRIDSCTTFFDTDTVVDTPKKSWYDTYSYTLQSAVRV